MFYKSSR